MSLSLIHLVTLWIREYVLFLLHLLDLLLGQGSKCTVAGQEGLTVETVEVSETLDAVLRHLLCVMPSPLP